MILGLGLSFLFIPLNLIAYSFLPPEKNNKASSLTNLFRNLGGSFGVAFVATMLSRRQQFHQTVLVGHVSPFDHNTTQTLHAIAERLRASGMPSGDSLAGAKAVIYSMVSKQAAMLSFLDVFWLLALLALCAIPFILFIKNIRRGGPAPAGH
jgi:DHA2 family multidrug resistance protein